MNDPTPLISFVIPVYNADRYLTACLDSITKQEFGDFEIIAVDGGSDDGSERTLDTREAVEPRLTVLHEARIGPGNARNIGAKRARGDYLWFVDADDVISAHCLSAVAGKLMAVAPDVLLIGYEIVNSRGTAQPGPALDVPEQVAAGCFTAAEYPKVLEISMASWNKIVRREFFASSGAVFSAVWPHEDIPVSCLVLLEAEKLSILSQVCYRYRSDSPGSAMTRGSDARRHFRVFDSWRPVLDGAQIRAKAGDAVITAEVYQALFERAMWYEAMLLDTGRFRLERLGSGGYVPWRHRREFFSLMSADFTRFEPPDYRPPSGLRRVKFGLIERGWPGVYSILDPVNKVRVWVGNGGHFPRGRIL